MNHLLIALTLSLGSQFAIAEEHQVKKVCVDVIKYGKPVKDAKGNTKQTCRDVKIHKKLEGHEVPVKK